MFRLLILLGFAGGVLGGCAQQPPVVSTSPQAGTASEGGGGNTADSAEKAGEAKAEAPPEEQAHGGKAEEALAAEEEKNLPKIPLTDALLYQYLLTEIAGQRGMVSTAKEGYLDMARTTRDPRIVRRAAEIAIFSRDQKTALEISRLWQELEPDSPRAVQTLAVLLVTNGMIEEAVPQLEKMLANGDPADGFMQLPGLFASTRDNNAVLKAMASLATRYPDLAEAHYAVGHAALLAGQNTQALEALKRAGELKPGWEAPALMQGQTLAKASRADALAFFKSFLQKHPQSRDVRLAYGRLLVSDNQLNEAGSQFARLSEEQPENAEIALAAGLLYLQISRMDEAEQHLTRAVELGRGKAGRRDGNIARFYLGQVMETRNNYDAAMEHYRSITTGEYYVLAKIRLATLLGRQGKRAEARAELKTVNPVNEAHRAQITLAEAELLRDAKEHVAAFNLLDAAVKASPDNLDLLYDRAMAAEKLNKLDLMEADLRKVIKLKPDYAHAYNALGYTLAERTNRLTEAADLLDKAYSLAPEDAFILDSLGWLYYRQGNLDKAKEFLERAWRMRQDPEIAAHLGEVLWARGNRDEASRIWASARQSHPDNEALIEILKKYQP